MGFFLYWYYIASLLCYSYVCLYYHACLHYVNKKWSDKDTDCTCCVYCILKWFTKLKSQESQLSVDIWHVQLFVIKFFFLSDDFTLSPLGVPPVRWILKGLKIIKACIQRVYYAYKGSTPWRATMRLAMQSGTLVPAARKVIPMM